MSININIEANISLQEMREQMDQGVSVMRSAHVGNARGYNLAVASIGIPMLLVDHTIVAQAPDQPGDKNYLPGSIVTRESIQPLSIESIGGLALRTETICPDTGAACFIDELHTKSLKTAFPDTEVLTNTEYLRKNEQIANEVVAAAIATRPELFARFVTSSGTVRKDGAFAESITSVGILQLNDDPRREAGVLLPNEVDIVINFVIEALKSERDTIIHLSGPDMQQYIKDSNMRRTLSQLYQAVRSTASFGSRLPAELSVKLVPANCAAFVTTPDRLDKMARIFAIKKAQSDIKAERDTFFKSPAARDDSIKAAFLKDTQLQNKALGTELLEVAVETDELFIGPREAPYISQYDLLDQGDIAIPAENMQWSMTELGTLLKSLRKLRGDSP